MDGFRAGIDEAAGNLGVSRPGGNQPPAEQGDRAGGVVINPAGGEALSGRTVIASASIRRQRRSPHAVEVANLLVGQMLSIRYPRPAPVESSTFPSVNPPSPSLRRPQHHPWCRVWRIGSPTHFSPDLHLGDLLFPALQTLRPPHNNVASSSSNDSVIMITDRPTARFRSYLF